MISETTKYLIFAWFSICSLLWADNALNVEVMPVSVRVSYEKEETCVEKINRGTEISVFIKTPDDINVESVMGEPIFFSNKNREGYDRNILLLKDSNVKNLGGCLGCRQRGVDDIYYFSFERKPTRGAKFLHLTGQIPVELWAHKEIDEAVTIPVEEGRELEIGGYRIVLFDVSEREKTLKDREIFWHADEDSDQYKYKIAFSIQWWDNKEEANQFDDIKILETDDNRVSFIKSDSFTENISFKNSPDPKVRDHSTERVYIFTELPESITIKVRHKTKKKLKIPVDVKFDLYPANGKEEK